MTPILPMLRINSHTHPVVGCHTATQDGIYEISFDNAYSRCILIIVFVDGCYLCMISIECNPLVQQTTFYYRFFAKDLFYRITTKPSIPNEHYLDQ